MAKVEIWVGPGVYMGDYAVNFKIGGHTFTLENTDDSELAEEEAEDLARCFESIGVEVQS